MGRFDFGKKNGSVMDKSREEMTAELIEEQKAALDEGKRLLESPEARDFVKSFKKVERDTIDALIRLNKDVFDPVTFTRDAKQILSKLETLRTLIDLTYGKAGQAYGD